MSRVKPSTTRWSVTPDRPSKRDHEAPELRIIDAPVELQADACADQRERAGVIAAHMKKVRSRKPATAAETGATERRTLMLKGWLMPRCASAGSSPGAGTQMDGDRAR